MQHHYPTEPRYDSYDAVNYSLLSPHPEGGTQLYTNQTYGYCGALQADTPIGNADVLITNGAHNPHQTDGYGMQNHYLIEPSYDSYEDVNYSLLSPHLEEGGTQHEMFGGSADAYLYLMEQHNNGADNAVNNFGHSSIFPLPEEGCTQHYPIGNADAQLEHMEPVFNTFNDVDKMFGGNAHAQLLHDTGNTSVTLPDPYQTERHGTQLVENAAAQNDITGFLPSEGGTQHEMSTRNAAAQIARRRLRSSVWNEFEFLELASNRSPVRVNCKHCGNKLKCPTQNGNGVLRRHLESRACPYGR